MNNTGKVIMILSLVAIGIIMFTDNMITENYLPSYIDMTYISLLFIVAIPLILWKVISD